MIHELSASSAQYAPERIAAFDRVTMYSSLAAGANGFLPWCYTDAAPQTFNRVPYLRAPHETQFGLTTWDRQDRPAGRDLRVFSQIMAQLDLDGVEPAPADAALIVPFEWAKPHGDFARFGLSGPSEIPYVSVQDRGGMPDPVAAGTNSDKDNLWLTGALLSAFILARQAGLKVAMPREYSAWQSHPLLLLPSPLTSTEANLVHVHTLFWQTVREYVEAGGCVYASLCADTAIPEMGDVFGATLADHMPADDVRLEFVAPFGDLKPGDVLVYEANGSEPRFWPATLDVADGKVLAVDQTGRPALVGNTYGKGRTLLSAYPLESYLAVKPAAFEGAERTHLLYAALATWANVTPLFATNHPSVEISALVGDRRGYAILANHRAEAQTVTITSREALKATSRLIESGAQPVEMVDAHTSQIEISGHQGAVLAWTR
jgi:hypothetical protein